MWGPSLRDIPKWMWPKRQAEEPEEREIRDLVCGETAYVPHWAYDVGHGLDTTFPVTKRPFGTSQMLVKRLGREEFKIDEAVFRQAFCGHCQQEMQWTFNGVVWICDGCSGSQLPGTIDDAAHTVQPAKTGSAVPLSKAERDEMRLAIRIRRSQSFGSHTFAVRATMNMAAVALDACDALSADLEELARVKDRYQVLAAERQYELAQLRALHGRL